MTQQITISKLSHIDFGNNGAEYKHIDGGLPIVPAGGKVTIKEIKGSVRVLSLHIINERTKVVTALTGGNFTTVSPCCVVATIPATVPCGVYRMYVNMAQVNPLNKILSLPFRVTKHTGSLVTIRTTNHDDIRYRSTSRQEYFYYYAYLSNWRERMAEKTTKYDNEQGEIVPLINHVFKTYQFSTYATCQHTLNMLAKVCNNDYINISFKNIDGGRTYYEVVKTSDAPTYGNYDRTNAGTFSCTFVGDVVPSETRVGLFVPLLQLVYCPTLKKSLPVSQMCLKIKEVEYGGTIWNFPTLARFRLDKVTELPDNFLNLRRDLSSYRLQNSNKVKKIGRNFGSIHADFDVYFENAEQIGAGFTCKDLRGLINLPQVVDKMHITTPDAKMYGSNITAKNCNLDTITKFKITFAKFEKCENKSLTDLTTIASKLIDGATFEDCRFVTNTKLPGVENLKVKNCNFIPQSNNNLATPYELDLSAFVGTLEGSFNMAAKEITITEAVTPTYKVDNSSFVGTKINSDYLKKKIDSIHRDNQGTGVYDNSMAINSSIEAVAANSIAVNINDRQNMAQLPALLTSFVFNADGVYEHAAHFLEGHINGGPVTLDFTVGTHKFNDYFLYKALITRVDLTLSQFMGLLEGTGFIPDKDTNIYVHDDGTLYDYYYFTLGDNLKGPAPAALYIESSLTELYAKLSDMGYPNLNTF